MGSPPVQTKMNKEINTMKALIIRETGSMTLENLRGNNRIRKILEGDIENIYLDSGMTLKMMINDSGKLMGMPRNRKADKIIEHYCINTDHICGPVVLAGVSQRDGSTVSISKKQLEEVFGIFLQYNPYDYYESFFNDNRRRLAYVIEDPDGLLYSYKGHIQGVYKIEFVYKNICLPAYVGQAGKIPGQPDYYATHVHGRLLQHLKRWFGNGYMEYYTGLPRVGKNSWKIRVRLLDTETSPERRVKLESDYIKKHYPFLQNHSGKYEYYSKKGNIDACILPCERARAFKDKLLEIQAV